jgi:hypothetical protein
LQLVGMSILLILLSPRLECYSTFLYFFRAQPEHESSSSNPVASLARAIFVLSLSITSMVSTLSPRIHGTSTTVSRWLT